MLSLLKLFKHFNLLLHGVRLGKLKLHVLLLDCLEFLLHNGELGFDIGSVKLELLLYLFCLDSLLREALLIIMNNLLLVGLCVLGELVHKVAHPLDFRLSIVKELLVLGLEGVQVEHELSLLLFQLEVLFTQLIELLVELHIAHSSLVARGRDAETLTTFRI